MSPDLEKILQSRYPSLYQELRGDPRTTGMSFGFEVGDGWFELINAASAIIAERGAEIGLEPVASQIKEKFGTLRCHFNGLNNDEFLRGTLRMASSLSTRICENCGSNGSLRGEGCGWFRVQCDECESNYRDGGIKKYKKENRPKAKLSSTSLSTLNPVFVFFHSGSHIFSKRISHTCFGDLILKSSPAISLIVFSSFSISIARKSPIS